MGKIRDLEVDDYLQKCVDIFPETISEEMAEVPAQLAYWNHRYAEALRVHLVAKLTSEREHARLAMLHRERLSGETDEKGKPIRVTEAQVDAAVAADPDWERVRLDEITAEVERVRAQGVARAVETKSVMAAAIAKQILAEKGADPVLRAMARDRAG